jgi:hypothetical protein
MLRHGQNAARFGRQKSNERDCCEAEVSLVSFFAMRDVVQGCLKRDFTTPLMELIPLGGTYEQFQSAELRAKRPQASFYRIA